MKVDVAQALFSSGRAVRLADGSIKVRFTHGDWSDVEVLVSAIDDAYVDGSDLQAFADRAQRTFLLQGPLHVFGGTDPQGDRSIPDPIMLPGETPGEKITPDSPSVFALEPYQVDTLNVFNNDSISDDIGSIVEDALGHRLHGLGMGPDQFVAGRLLRGGITLGDLEALNVHLGHGQDTFTIETTHDGTTRVTGGDPFASDWAVDDTFYVRTVDGHTTIEGMGGNDRVYVGTTAGLSGPGTINQIAALLTIDGGLGDDYVSVDDSLDQTRDLGWLTQTTLTGLDMVARNGIDRQFSVTAPAAGGFTITLAGIGKIDVAAGASAQAVEEALQALIFPDASSCGQFSTSDCARSVHVQKFGRDYLILFRGERNGLARTDDLGTPDLDDDLVFLGGPVLTATGANGVALDVRRIDGINYYGLETLDISLGQGDDVLNVRGTLPLTNVWLNDGSERVYVSHLADVGIDGRPDYLRGHLDDIDGTLNLDFGTGRHTLMISDEMASAGDTNVLITDVLAAAKARHADFNPAGEIFIAGLATGGISYRSATGDFRDGITIWSGSGDDTIVIDGTRFGGPGREITSLNTGLGNDHVTVDLDTGEDGFFVLNTQGAYDNRVQLTTDLSLGDLPLPADIVRVYRNGTLVGADRYSVDYATDSIGLFDSFSFGDVIGVDVTSFSLVTATGDGTTKAFSVAGTRVSAFVNGEAATGTFANGTFTFDSAPSAGSYVTFHVETDRARQTFTIPQASFRDDDKVFGEASTLPLIIFGGQGADRLSGGEGTDIVIGDRGRVMYHEPGTKTPVVMLGNGGPDDRIFDGRVLTADLISTEDMRIGAGDTIYGRGDMDVLIGGAAGDDVDGGMGDDLVFGDQVVLERRPGVFTNPRFQLLTSAGRIYSRTDLDAALGQGFTYDNSGQLLILGVAQNHLDRSGQPTFWREYEIKDLFHSFAIAASHDWVNTFGDDYLAGGGNDDQIFGQLGNDVIQGDGDIDSRPDGVKVGVERVLDGPFDTLGRLVIHASTARATDGDDYIEGNGGNDVIFGGLGQDDIIGGSSSCSRLDTARHSGRTAPTTCSAGRASARHGAATEPASIVHARDATRSSATTATSTGSSARGGQFLSFNYDDAYGDASSSSAAITLLDYTPGGPDFRPTASRRHPRRTAAPIAAAGGDEIHGESGDDCIYGARGDDRLFGDGEDDDIIGGWGNDWISGGTGEDGILGDDGRIFTSRNGTAEPLYGVDATTQAADQHARQHAGGDVSTSTGQLKKAVDLTPFNLTPNASGADDPLFEPVFADDIIFGGLGNDFLHGGSGDDAISGAEALPSPTPSCYAPDGDARWAWSGSTSRRPFNPGDLLHFVDGEQQPRHARAGEFALYDEFDPLRMILLADNGGTVEDRRRQAVLPQLPRPATARSRATACSPTATT